MKTTLIKYITALPGAALAWFLALPTVIHGLLILMAIDIVTGLLVAGKKGEISSDKSWVGMRKKATMLLLVAASAVVAWAFQLPSGLATATAGMFCLVELLSICENAGRLQVPIPKVLASTLEKLRQEIDAGDGMKGRKGSRVSWPFKRKSDVPSDDTPREEK